MLLILMNLLSSNQEGTENDTNDNIDDESVDQDGIICDPDDILG